MKLKNYIKKELAIKQKELAIIESDKLLYDNSLYDPKIRYIKGQIIMLKSINNKTDLKKEIKLKKDYLLNNKCPEKLIADLKGQINVIEEILTIC